jgi:hypothetical protein
VRRTKENYRNSEFDALAGDFTCAFRHHQGYWTVSGVKKFLSKWIKITQIVIEGDFFFALPAKCR